MKKINILLFLFLLFLFPLVSASQIELSKQEFDSGETLFAQISGNFVDQITSQNVNFYRGHVKIPMVYEVEKIDEEFYVYALLTGKDEGNYSLRIEGVRYYKATEVTDETIRENFTISNRTADFSISPGFLSTTSGFSVELQNLVDKRITVGVNSSSRVEPESEELKLNIGEKKSFSFGLNSPQSKETISFKTENTEYVFTLFVSSGSATPTEEFEKDFMFETQAIEVSMATKSETKRVIYLKNTGEADLTGVELNVSGILQPYIEFNPSRIDELDSNESVKIELSIISDVEEATLEGLVTAYVFEENLTTSSVIILDFVKDFIPQEGQSEETASAKYCEEVGGEICGESFECDGDIFYAQDGTCCLGSCEPVSESSTGKWIGWALVVLVVLIVFWFFKSKYKKAGTKKSGLLKFLKKK